MRLLDANVILRYLLKDHPAMAQAAREAVMEGAETTPEVLAEVVYVLNGYYNINRQEIAGTLLSFLNEIEMAEKASVKYALRLFAEKRLDFVDCLLAGYHHVRGREIVTFDQKLRAVLANDPFMPVASEDEH